MPAAAKKEEPAKAGVAKAAGTATAKPAAGAGAAVKSTAPATKSPATKAVLPAAKAASATAGKPAATGAAAAKSPSKGPAVVGKAAAVSSPKATAGSKSSAAAKPGAKKAAAGGAKVPNGGASGAVVPEPGAQEEAPPSEEELRRREAQRAAAEAEMEELRQKAWLAQVEFERKQEAKRRKQQEEEARIRREQAALRKALLEAAFDGDVDELKKLFAKAAPILRDPHDVADAHGNTLLSEAAAGGAQEAVTLLLSLGADPNSQGEFKRTPLWRAAFLGKAEVVGPLLEGGADPRVTNEAGEMPLHVVTEKSIKEALAAWDESRTDALVAQWRSRREASVAAAAAQHAAELRSAEGEEGAAAAAHEKAQQQLKHARQELEKRIFEHDMCVEEKKPDDLIKVTLEQIHVAEAAVEQARQHAQQASERLAAARLALREKRTEDQGEGAASLPGIPVQVRELDDVLVRDVGDKVAADGRWPLVIDPSGQASVFLRYMDSNYVNALSPAATQPDRLRRSLLGSIRYGKPMVLDTMEVDVWHELPRLFDAVQPGLFDKLMDKSILKNDSYKSLIRKEDGEEYDANKFQDARLSKFKFVLLTAAKEPKQEMVDRCYALHVVIKG